MGVGKWQNTKTNMCISLSNNPPTDNPHSTSLLSVLTIIIIIPKTYSEMSLGAWNLIPHAEVKEEHPLLVYG